MKIVRIDPEDTRKLTELTKPLGRSFTLSEMLKFGGTGSPQLYYAGKNSELDQLQEEAERPIKIQFERYTKGLLGWIHLSKNYTFGIALPYKNLEIQFDHLTQKSFENYTKSDRWKEEVKSFILWFRGFRPMPEGNYVKGIVRFKYLDSLIESPKKEGFKSSRVTELELFLDEDHYYNVFDYFQKIKAQVEIITLC